MSNFIYFVFYLHLNGRLSLAFVMCQHAGVIDSEDSIHFLGYYSAALRCGGSDTDSVILHYMIPCISSTLAADYIHLIGIAVLNEKQIF